LKRTLTPAVGLHICTGTARVAAGPRCAAERDDRAEFYFERMRAKGMLDAPADAER
jgi:hypothetical protein